MPAPYSDNLYSDPDPVRDDATANANEHAEADALSPSDGYFHASSPQDDSPLSPTSHHRRQSGNVPFVPNVLVEDPSLQQRQGSSDKANEAEQERLINSPGGAPPTSPTAQSHSSPTTSHYPSVTHYSHNPLRSPTAASSTVSYTPAPSSSGRNTASPGHHHRRSVDEDHITYHPSQPQHSSLSSSSHPAGHPSGVVHNASGPSDAPPAYTPTSPTSTGYQTFPSTAPSNADNMGVPEENQSLLPRQPQSMGGYPQGTPPPMWQRLKDAPRSSKFRSRLKTVLGILVIFSILFALFGGITISRSTFPKPPRFDTHPIRKPDMDDGDLAWKPHSGCLDRPQSIYSSVYNPSFNLGDSLNVVQKIRNRGGHRDGRSPNIFGDVIVRPTDDKNGKINVEIITNHPDLDFDVSYNSGRQQELRIETTNNIPWTENKSPCVQMRVTLWVPEGAYLNWLSIDTTQLDVTVADGLSLGTGGGFSFSTVTGNVLFPDHTPNSKEVPYKVASREIVIETVSGNIQGWFPLYDLLKLSTTSGDITTDHAPQPAESKNSDFARFIVRSVSGVVKLKQSLRPDPSSNKMNVPLRAYTHDIETTSGNIETDLVIGETTNIKSISGTLKLDLLPIVPTDAGAGNHFLKTDSMSGTLRLNLADPVEFDQDDLEKYKRSALKHLRSEHQAVSGNMKIKYPVSWEGKLTGQAVSANWNIHGKGVQVTRRGGFLHKNIEATKGKGDSTIKIDEMSGNVDVLLGED